MKPKIMELKEEIKQLAKDIRLSKYRHRDNCRHGHLLCPYLMKHGHYLNKNIYFSIRDNGFIKIGSAIPPIEIIKQHEECNKMAIENHCYLVEKQFLYRHLSIVYGLLRGKTREYMEPKWKENPSPYNPITKKYILGKDPITGKPVNVKDPIDWDFISELKRKYSEEFVLSDNSQLIGDRNE